MLQFVSHNDIINRGNFFYIAFLAAPAGKPIGSCVNKKKYLTFFAYFHDSFTRNGDYLILFIETGNAQKIRILSQTMFDTVLLKSVRLVSNGDP